MAPKTTDPANPNPRQRLVATLLSEFTPHLYRFLVYRMGNRDDAQDIAQEAYLRLLRVDKMKIIHKPESYLFRIASNLANELTMQERKTPPSVDFDILADTHGDGDDFERSLEHRAAIRRLEDILAGFPAPYRAVLLLRKRDGLSREEIAQELGISVHTVKKYLARAVARCREEWGE